MDRMDPYCQGDLDGLCGLYAIINALCALCPEIDEDIALGMFGHLARHMQGAAERADASYRLRDWLDQPSPAARPSHSLPA